MKRSRSHRRIEDLLRFSSRFNRGKRKPKDKGGSEAVPVEPNNPKLNQGGAAAELEFDE
jgi:hypothetical protein